MIQPRKKAREKFFVEDAARHLGVIWSLGPDRESPDFIITEGLQIFGLEVCEIFTGPQNRAGSLMKKSESIVRSELNRLRIEYEASNKLPLTVKFVGDLSAANMAGVVPALIAEDFGPKPPGYYTIIDKGNGLRIHVTRSFRSEWYSINHRVGWVDRNPMKQITNAIEAKSKELPRYKTAADDVRLLIVADRMSNSGKLVLQQSAPFDLCGFSAVYFFSYPESVTILSQAADAA